MSKTVINKRDQIKWDNGFDPNGKNIPDITESDEGKFIKVVDGVLAFGEGGGSGSTYTAGDNIQISADNVISATDTTYTAGDNVEISADNEISSVNTIVFNAKYFRATDTFQYDATAIAPFLAEVYKNDKRAIVRVQDGNYNIYDIYTLISYESYNNNATFTKSNPIIVSANQREIVCAYIKLSVSNNVGTLNFTSTGITDLPEGATAGQIPISDGHSGWIAGNIPTELPSVSSSDEGKVLKVNSNGNWSVGTDNDTTYTAGTNVQINGTVISATDTTYTAGDGIDITAQVVSSPDAVMTKNGIADTYSAGYPFVKISDTQPGASMVMSTDAIAAQTVGSTTAGPYAYDSSRTDIYAAIFKDVEDHDNYKLLLITAGPQHYQSTTVVYINEDGTVSSGTNPYITQAFSGTVNSGFVIPRASCLGISGTWSYSTSSLIACAGDLNRIVYDSYQDAVDAFGSWTIDSLYDEGTQVWKDGKLQTYTSGSWVDSDTIVEQIANAKELPSYSSSDNGKVLSVDSNGDLEWATSGGGGGGSETWTAISTGISANWNWGDYRDVIPNYDSNCPTKSVWNTYKKIAIIFKQDPSNLGWCEPRTNWLKENDNFSTYYSTPKVFYGVKLPSGDWAFDTIAVSGEDTQSSPTKWGSSSVSCYFRPNEDDPDQTNPRWGLYARFSNFVYNDGTTNNGLIAIIGTVDVYGIS